MTTSELDDLDWTVTMLEGAARLLGHLEPTTPGIEYILDKVRQDIDRIVGPVQELIVAARRPKRRAARSERREINYWSCSEIIYVR